MLDRTRTVGGWPTGLPAWTVRRLDEGFLNPFRAEPLGRLPKDLFRDPADPPLPRFLVPIHPHHDRELRLLVDAVLAADPSLPPRAPICVEVARGVVTLGGWVPSAYLRQAAEQDAWLVPGVRDVRNRLRVQPVATTAGARP